VRLTGALASDDTRIMAEALRQLGFAVEADERTHTLFVAKQAQGFPAREKPVELFVGLAGTAARFLTALCAVAPRGVYHLDGVPQMRKRPMQPLLDALRVLGADIRCTGEEGFFPFEIHARGLAGGAATIDASESSQLLSALLLVAPLARKPVELTLTGAVRWPFVEMTARLMEHFGQPAFEEPAENVLRLVPGTRYHAPGAHFVIEPDATAASYFLALPLATGGHIELPGLHPPGRGLQGDTQFMPVLEKTGLTVSELDGHAGVESWIAKDAPRAGVSRNFSEFSDTFLTLAAVAPLLSGPTRITGIAHTRKQETDRVAGAARELRKLGQAVVEENDSLTITPQPLTSGVEIETYGDHRFAMSFAILGCHDLHGTGRPWLTIKDPGCCAKTFPNFFELLESMRKKSLAT
jgi:3-phosphoshikimate 1-carboxyvinyltransferase